MDTDSQILIKAEKWGWGRADLRGTFSRDPHLSHPISLEDIVANPYVIQVTKELLGPGLYNNFYNGQYELSR